jgi:hypothetical protein
MLAPLSACLSRISLLKSICRNCGQDNPGTGKWQDQKAGNWDHQNREKVLNLSCSNTPRRVLFNSQEIKDVHAIAILPFHSECMHHHADDRMPGRGRASDSTGIGVHSPSERAGALSPYL